MSTEQNKAVSQPIQSAELAELRRLAEAAMPGDWTHKKYGVIVAGPFHQYTNGSAQSQIACFNVTNGGDGQDEDYQVANANFIAAANPSAILRLLDALSALPTQPVQSEPEQAKPFGYFHELLNHEGKGNGVWLGSYEKSVTERSYIEGETGKQVIALYAAPALPAATQEPSLTDAVIKRIANENLMCTYGYENDPAGYCKRFARAIERHLTAAPTKKG